MSTSYTDHKGREYPGWTTINIVWLSRHTMDKEQRYELECTIARNKCVKHQDCEFTYETRNLTWASSRNEDADLLANRAIWESLNNEFDAIAAVLPQVAHEAILRDYRGCEVDGPCTDIYVPISAQNPALRVGDGPIPFEFLRWSKVK